MRAFGGVVALLVGYSFVTWQLGIATGDSRYLAMADSVWPWGFWLGIVFVLLAVFRWLGRVIDS